MVDVQALSEQVFADLPVDRIANVLGFKRADVKMDWNGKQKTFRAMLKESVRWAFPCNTDKKARASRYYNTLFQDERLALTISPMVDGGKRFAVVFLSTSPPCVWKVCYPG